MVNLVVEYDYPFFLNHLFFGFQSIFSGFMVGFFGKNSKNKGWVLGLILGCYIALCLFAISLIFGTFNNVTNLFKILEYAGSFFTIYFLCTLVIILGSVLGESFKRSK